MDINTPKGIFINKKRKVLMWWFFFRKYRAQWRWSMVLIEKIGANFRVSAFFLLFDPLISLSFSIYLSLSLYMYINIYATVDLLFPLQSIAWITTSCVTFKYEYDAHIDIFISIILLFTLDFKWKLCLIISNIIIIDNKPSRPLTVFIYR